MSADDELLRHLLEYTETDPRQWWETVDADASGEAYWMAQRELWLQAEAEFFHAREQAPSVLAAARVAELEAENARLVGMSDHAMSDENERLRWENLRLREALEVVGKLIRPGPTCATEQAVSDHPLSQAYIIARAAIGDAGAVVCPDCKKLREFVAGVRDAMQHAPVTERPNVCWFTREALDSIVRSASAVLGEQAVP